MYYMWGVLLPPILVNVKQTIYDDLEQDQSSVKSAPKPRVRVKALSEPLYPNECVLYGL